MLSSTFHSLAQSRCFRLLFCIGFTLAFLAGNLESQSPPLANEPDYSQETVDRLVSALPAGDFQRGLKIYTSAKLACFSCHKVATTGGVIGPELTQASKQRSANELAESLLWPNRKIVPEYQPIKILTEDGEVVTGFVSNSESDDTSLAMLDPATQKVRKIPRNSIESQSNAASLMPSGLLDSLAINEQADLLRFLVDIGQRKDLDLPAIEASIRTATTHEPTSFPLDTRPLHPQFRPAWQAHVNRDRVYDFYAKQASYFIPVEPRPEWLSSFPGLDGAGFGHWGNQDEATWRGDRWNRATLGPVLCNVFITDGPPISRAVCIHLGSDEKWSACYNSDTGAYEKTWTGGFVSLSPVRHGYIDGVRMVGTEQALPAEARPIHEILGLPSNVAKEYLGYYIDGDQILFRWRLNGKEYLDAPYIAEGAFQRRVAELEEHPMRERILNVQKQIPKPIETRILLGSGKGLVVDTIELPTENLWNMPIACGDHGFLSDGSAIVATMQGDVWRVTGITQSSAKTQEGRAQWTRIANGLHHLLGVWVEKDEIFVLGRNQITRLHDLNQDGATDFYECFSRAFETSPSGHDYICGLQRDRAGNFYTASGNQGILQISKDGKQSQVIATGFRNPDGLGLLPDGTLTVPSSEGEWTPTSMISQVLPTKGSKGAPFTYPTNPIPFYGYGGPRDQQTVELPLVFLPRGLDNSSGGQVWVDDPRMGPLHQSLIHTSFGAGTAMLVLRDQVGTQWQGAVVQLPGEYRAGVHRAHLNPADGHLYLTGMNGWGSYTPDEGCFQRLRYTGDEIQLPTGFHVHSNGIVVRFRHPTDPNISKNPKAHFAQCWNYRYSPGYGSEEYSALHPPMIGHDCLNIASAHVVEDGFGLFLELPDLQLCNQLHLSLAIDGNDRQEIFATVHAVDKDRSDFPGYQANTHKKWNPHPMVRDLEWLKRSIPNPWRTRIANARNVRIEARDNLQFSTKTLEVAVGEKVKLTFANPDVVPHNWALLKPGSLEKVGNLANRLVNDPDAYLKHYVPDSDAVICYTDVVDPKGETAIYFETPKEPGRYPYLCTFPGHWMVMNGELIVK